MEDNMFTDEKKSKSTALYIAGSIACTLIIGFFLLTNGGSSGNEHLQVKQMQKLADKVQGMESDMKTKENQVIELVDEYQTKTGTRAPMGFDLSTLNGKERELMEQYIAKEKDVSAKTLLKEILMKQDEISELKEKIAAIEEVLPTPHIAQKGESHYRIALSFLVDEKGLDKDRAVKILSRTALFEELAEGFNVWNFFTGDEYGTSVTQGTAIVSPNVFVHRAKKQMMDDRDKAISERDKLAENIKSMEEKQDEINGQMAEVEKEKETLIASVSDLNRQMNSMHYRLDSQKNLKKNGILKTGFLSSPKLTDVSPETFDRSLDLTAEDQLTISAQDLGVQKIKDVVLYPGNYKKGKSYKVMITRDKKYALLTLLDTTKFKSERVVIAVK